jgi:hypothetical protein
MSPLAGPIGILKEATKRVPSLKYAIGLTGMAAALAIILSLTGEVGNPVVPLGLLFAGMVLLFLFSTAVATGVYGGVLIGSILVWAVAGVFLIFMFFFVSVFYDGKPCNFALTLGVKPSQSCPVIGENVDNPNADIDKQPIRPKVPETTVHSFTYDAADWDKPGPRYWSRLGPDRWVERTPDGKEAFFKEGERINYGDCDGSIVARFGDEKFQMFIPEKGCANMNLKFRWTPTDDWHQLPVMYDIS